MAPSISDGNMAHCYKALGMNQIQWDCLCDWIKVSDKGEAVKRVLNGLEVHIVVCPLVGTKHIKAAVHTNCGVPQGSILGPIFI